MRWRSGDDTTLQDRQVVIWMERGKDWRWNKRVTVEGEAYGTDTESQNN